MANEIESLVKSIQETEQNRTNTFQELAHDIRTPVTGLLSMVESIHEYHETMSKTELKEFTSASLSECRYIGDLAEDLLFISGVEQVKYVENFKKLDLLDIIKLEASLFPKIEIQNKTDLDKLIVNGDAFLLKRLIRNSFENAISFCQEKTVVQITSDLESIRLNIIDDGPGLDQEMIKAFGEKSFSRKEKKSNSHESRLSIGLGSFIMKKIITLHSGQMKISNIMNQNKIQGAKLELIFKKN